MESTSPQATPSARDARGRFGKGNPGGPGNPHAQRTAKLRAAMLKAVKPKDITDIVAALVDQARKGNVTAARELLDRTIGPASLIIDLADRVAELEQRIERLIAARAQKGKGGS